MALTAAQLLTLKNDILAAPDMATHLANGADDLIAAAYNLAASPAFTVWKSNVPLGQIGDAIDGAELAGLTSLNTTRLQMMFTISVAGVNAGLANRRQFFDDIFSGAGGALTRAALLVLWKRLATRTERLFASGTGSDASPGTLTFEGTISGTDVQHALRG